MAMAMMMGLHLGEVVPGLGQVVEVAACVLVVAVERSSCMELSMALEGAHRLQWVGELLVVGVGGMGQVQAHMMHGTSRPRRNRNGVAGGMDQAAGNVGTMARIGVVVAVGEIQEAVGLQGGIRWMVVAMVAGALAEGTANTTIAGSHINGGFSSRVLSSLLFASIELPIMIFASSCIEE